VRQARRRNPCASPPPDARSAHNPRSRKGRSATSRKCTAPPSRPEEFRPPAHECDIWQIPRAGLLRDFRALLVPAYPPPRGCPP
jgi:hypothetical protein